MTSGQKHDPRASACLSAEELRILARGGECVQKSCSRGPSLTLAPLRPSHFPGTGGQLFCSSLQGPRPHFRVWIDPRTLPGVPGSLSSRTGDCALRFQESACGTSNFSAQLLCPLAPQRTHTCGLWPFESRLLTCADLRPRGWASAVLLSQHRGHVGQELVPAACVSTVSSSCGGRGAERGSASNRSSVNPRPGCPRTPLKPGQALGEVGGVHAEQGACRGASGLSAARRWST